MMRPSIYGENLFDDFFEDDSFWDDSWEKELNRRMNQLSKASKKNPLFGKNAKNLMKTDVRELEDHYEVDVDLPGFKKDEVNAVLDNGYITISASKGLDKSEKDKKTGKFLRQERYAGALSRSFYVGDEYEQSEIGARFENGILSLNIPKKENTKKVENTNRILIE